MQPFGTHNLLADVPASLIEYHQDLLVRPCAESASELGERQRIGSNRDCRQQQPKGLTTAWADKTVQVHPLVAMLHLDNWSLASSAPDPSDDRFEADTVFVHRPYFHLGIRMCACEMLHCLRKRFFETLVAQPDRSWYAVAAEHTS